MSQVEAEEQDMEATAQKDKSRSTHKALSQREQDVLELLTWGKSNKEIAKALNIGSQTVKTHLSHIFAKLGTPDRAGAVGSAFRNGLVE